MKFNKPISKLFAILSVFLLLYNCKPQKQPPPNIIFIMSDDHTSQAWGIYGGILKDYVKTPNIQRLANEGVMLKNVFCTNSICTPSRASILTGQYSHRNGVYTLSEALEPDSNNIAKVLKKNGYQTAIVGKWHLKKQPSGFDYFNVLPGQGRYHNPVLKTKDNWEDHYKGGKEYEGFSSDVITDFAIDWLENRDTKKPFFLMTHFKATHEPFDYPERHKDLYKDVEMPEPESLYDFGPQTTGRSFVGQKLENLGYRWEQATKNPENWWTTYPGLPFSTEGLDNIQVRKKIYQKFIKDFLRCGAAIDDNIGKLLDYLDVNELAENTVVIYTSDQGYFLGEHGFFDKRLMYEESLRMPFVMRYPKEIKGGSKNDDLILNIDFPSLFADYANIEPPTSMQGASFRNNVQGATPENWRTSMYYRYWLHQKVRPGHFGIRNNRYKLIFFYGQPLGKPGANEEVTEPAWEFYDLNNDPNELNNVYNNTKYTAIIKNLKKELLIQKEFAGDSDEPYPIMQNILMKNWD